MQSIDHNLFLTLNFDGGCAVDRLMLTLSGTAMWLPLYALICYLVWRKYGWQRTLLFVVLLVAALGLADMIAGIFKHNGLLGDVMPNLEPRLRPMFTPSLEGIDITADSLATLRRTGAAGQWRVHVPIEAVSGRYGTVSAHAATIVALAVLSASVIGRRWFSALVVVATLLICYSRIYLAKHFPMDLMWGTLLGLALGYGAVWVFRRVAKSRK